MNAIYARASGQTSTLPSRYSQESTAEFRAFGRASELTRQVGCKAENLCRVRIFLSAKKELIAPSAKSTISTLQTPRFQISRMPAVTPIPEQSTELQSDFLSGICPSGNNNRNQDLVRLEDDLDIIFNLKKFAGRPNSEHLEGSTELPGPDRNPIAHGTRSDGSADYDTKSVKDDKFFFTTKCRWTQKRVRPNHREWQRGTTQFGPRSEQER